MRRFAADEAIKAAGCRVIASSIFSCHCVTGGAQGRAKSIVEAADS